MRPRRTGPTRRAERGAAALTLTLGLVLIMTTLGLAFLVYARRQTSLVTLDRDSALALYAAEAGFERARRDLEAAWRGYLAARANKAEHQLRWFRCTSEGLASCDATAFAANRFLPASYQNVPFPADAPVGRYSVAVSYEYRSQDANDPTNYAHATLTVTGQAGMQGKEKIVEGVVRFEVAPSQIFNYAYFINNKAILDIGATARINGNVRANGNIEVRSGVINGEVIAGRNDAIGSGNGQAGEGCVENPSLVTFDGTATYQAAAPISKRPIKPGVVVP
jgi:Tfp pilus assembly protein PilX